MECTKCGGDTKVVDSRSKEKSTFRRRVCLEKKCGFAFQTKEVVLGAYENMSTSRGGRPPKVPVLPVVSKKEKQDRALLDDIQLMLNEELKKAPITTRETLERKKSVSRYYIEDQDDDFSVADL